MKLLEEQVLQSDTLKPLELIKPQARQSSTPLSELLQQNAFAIDNKEETKEQLKYIKLQLTVEDNGAGISKQNLGKLFKDYSRLEEHEGMNAKGTGLGLSICKNIIEQMGGDVEVTSELGKGTMFKINLNIKATDKQLPQD